MRLLFYVIAIHENIFSTGVTMQIAVENYFSFLYKRSNQFFDSWVYWMQNFWGSFPPTIQILSCQWASIISINHTIRIQNRHYFKYKMISQCFSFRSVADQEFNHTLHHPRRVTFSRMHPCAYKNSLFGHRLGTFRILVLACNCQIIAPVSSQGPCQSTFMIEILAIRFLVDPAQIFL